MASGSGESRQGIERLFQLSLLLLLANGYLSFLLTGHLDPAIGTLVAVALTLRLLSVLGLYPLDIPKPVPTLLALAYVGFYAADYFLLSGKFVEATLRMLFFFSALKLLIAKTGRDYFYLALLAFLQLLSASMFISGVSYLGILLVFLVLAVMAYVTYEIKRNCDAAVKVVEDGQPRFQGRLGRRLVFLSGSLAVGILLLSGGLFLVLPRVLGRTPASPLRAELSIGFASEVDLGLTGSLEPDYTPVMRIESLGGSVEGLRWRGVALRYFDGTRWTNPPPLSLEAIAPESGRYALPEWFRRSEKGHRIRYRVTLEPLATSALFLAGLPEQISGTFRTLLVSDTDTLSAPTSGLQPLRYEVYSWISERQSRRPAQVSEFFTEKFREKYLQLPKIDPRIRVLADQITTQEIAPLAKAEALEKYLRTQYGYTLDLPARRVKDPLAHFLFERRKGHCEYFASAMTVMLRSMGIAARLVNGFVGGVHNPVSGLHVVRSRDAHSWVEAYIPRYGWLEFDPTPPDPRVMSDPWLAQAWMYWDAVQSIWSEWVLDYDVGHQIELARAVHNQSRSALYGLMGQLDHWFSMVASLGARLTPSGGESSWEAGRGLLAAAGALAVMLLGGTWLARWGGPRLVARHRGRRIAAGRGRPSDCLYFYARALDVLQRHGLRRNRWQTPQEFAQSIDRAEFRSLIAQITATYNAARFGRDSAAEKSLPILVAALERAHP